MSHELVLVVVVALLWGPTALWLLYRAAGPHPGRSSEPTKGMFEPTPASQLHDDINVLLGRDGVWVCATCRSVNGRDARRCYSCRAERVASPELVPGELEGRPLVPVMAEGLAPAPVRQPAPTVGLLPEPATLPVCPLIRLRGDPSSRFDFPHPGNACYAASVPDSTPRVLRWWRERPSQRGQEAWIDLEHQESRCLTSAHAKCERYPRVDVVPTTIAGAPFPLLGLAAPARLDVAAGHATARISDSAPTTERSPSRRSPRRTSSAAPELPAATPTASATPSLPKSRRRTVRVAAAGPEPSDDASDDVTSDASAMTAVAARPSSRSSAAKAAEPPSAGASG
jgi:hypothetical protein